MSLSGLGLIFIWMGIDFTRNSLYTYNTIDHLLKKEQDMKAKRWVVIMVILSMALLLSGCINIAQEYWLNADGSAKISIDMGVSESLLSMSGGTSSSPLDQMKADLDSKTNPLIKNVQGREYTEKDMRHYAVTFEVTKFDEFVAQQKKSGDETFDITLEKKSNGNIVFKQTLKMDSSNTGMTGTDAKQLESAFKDMYWSVVVHVPEVVSTDGTKKDGGTVEWKIPMAEIFSGKTNRVLTVEYNPAGNAGVGGSTALIIVLVVLALLIVAAALVYFLVLRKRAPAPAYSAPTPAQPVYPAQGAYPQQPQAPQYPQYPQYPQQPQPPQPPQSPPQGQYPQYPQYPQQPQAPQYPQYPQQQPPQPPQYPQQGQYPQYPQYPQQPPQQPPQPPQPPKP